MPKPLCCTTSQAIAQVSEPKIGAQVITCLATEIEALLPWAEQYYQEDELAFDAVQFSRALIAALEQNRGSAWWLCSAGERVGYALMMDSWSIEFGGFVTILDEIYVLHAWRGKGLASGAILELRQQSRARGAVMMCMETTPDNLSAQKLYQRLGFTHTRRPVFRALLNGA
jgi:GNAT superfamily N-acetyltransferase